MRRGILLLALVAVCGLRTPAVAAAPQGGGSPSIPLLAVHGAAMGASFLLLFTAMLFPRRFKHRRWWLKAHRRMATAGGMLGVLGVGLAAYAVASTGGTRLRLPHPWMGASTLALILLTGAYGQLMLKVRRDPRRFRVVHRWLGRLTLLSMAATILLGLFALDVL